MRGRPPRWVAWVVAVVVVLMVAVAVLLVIAVVTLSVPSGLLGDGAGTALAGVGSGP